MMALDISSDSRLIITGSADKNVKIWGLDFGDCHKSIFAHSDSIMTVGFVPGTHYFFSAGKDRMIKYWDGDKFDQILTVPGHHGEVCVHALQLVVSRSTTCGWLCLLDCTHLFKEDQSVFLHFSLTLPMERRNFK